MMRLLLLLASVVGLAGSCYLQSCPLYGKRVPRDSPSLRECPSCGEGGRCLGEATCCADSGCILGLVEATRPCRGEGIRSDACVPKGEPCQILGGDQGFCAAKGLCCSPFTCQLHPSCKAP